MNGSNGEFMNYPPKKRHRMQQQQQEQEQLQLQNDIDSLDTLVDEDEEEEEADESICRRENAELNEFSRGHAKMSLPSSTVAEVPCVIINANLASPRAVSNITKENSSGNKKSKKSIDDIDCASSSCSTSSSASFSSSNCSNSFFPIIKAEKSHSDENNQRGIIQAYHQSLKEQQLQQQATTNKGKYLRVKKTNIF